MGKTIAFFVVWLVLVVAIVYGWVANIINIAAYETIEFTSFVGLQFVGIFLIPLGIVMGYIG